MSDHVDRETARVEPFGGHFNLEALRNNSVGTPGVEIDDDERSEFDEQEHPERYLSPGVVFAASEGAEPGTGARAVLADTATAYRTHGLADTDDHEQLGAARMEVQRFVGEGRWAGELAAEAVGAEPFEAIWGGPAHLLAEAEDEPRA
ncbi:MAG: hypothetical protein H7288_00175 [Kineosporiaceae bacterium]|nr:hypothetical protein [Aeromicrobium sp.]